jgi:TIR domain
MVKGPLPDRLEFAILQIVMSVGGKHQNFWGDWANAVRRLVPDLLDIAELQAAFTRLSKRGYLSLTKWNTNAQRDIEYSGNEQDAASFFYGGTFGATITAEGRGYWGKLNLPQRDGIFVSHITEEKPVAHVLQKYLKLAFGDRVPVFVSSDAKSIGGGKKWYNHIIDHLRLSEIVLVLVSQESKSREWINFEAGFGEGLESLVIPVGIKHIALGQLSFPLAGIQARSIDDIGPILDDIGNRLGNSPGTIDMRAYLRDMEEAEASLIYRSVGIEPVPNQNSLSFDIQNVGNVDLELLMFEVHLPRSVLLEHYHGAMAGMAEVASSLRNGIPYVSYYCYSNRGVVRHFQPILRPIITPSMGKVRPILEIPIRLGLSSSERDLPIFFQIHAIGYRTEQEERRIADLPGWA